jgi:hypothetical protein
VRSNVGYVDVSVCVYQDRGECECVSEYWDGFECECERVLDWA